MVTSRIPLGTINELPPKKAQKIVKCVKIYLHLHTNENFPLSSSSKSGVSVERVYSLPPAYAVVTAKTNKQSML